MTMKMDLTENIMFNENVNILIHYKFDCTKFNVMVNATELIVILLSMNIHIGHLFIPEMHRDDSYFSETLTTANSPDEKKK